MGVKKGNSFRRQKEWKENRPYTSTNILRTMWGMTILGPALVCFSVYTFFHLSGAAEGAVISSLGSLVFGLGMTVFAGSTMLTYYFKLSEKNLFWAQIAHRSGLMVLGPGIALFSFPSIIREKNVSPGQCSLICIAFCSITLVPAGISLLNLIFQHRKKPDKKKKDKEPWE